MKKKEQQKPRKIIQCDEASIPKSKNEDVVLVEKNDYLFYYHVNSCMTVTLIFDSFMVGGHVGMSTTQEKDSKVDSCTNLQKVIKKMYEKLENINTNNKTVKQIQCVGDYGVGQNGKYNWEIKDDLFNKFTKAEGVYASVESIDTSSNIIFDLENKKIYISNWNKKQKDYSNEKIVNDILKEKDKVTYDINTTATIESSFK